MLGRLSLYTLHLFFLPWIKLFPVLLGQVVQELAVLLLKVALKFQTLISKLHQYFLLKKMWEAFAVAKASLIFSTKNISVFGNKVVKHLTSWPLHELVKLTMLWRTGPRSIGPVFQSISTLSQRKENKKRKPAKRTKIWNSETCRNKDIPETFTSLYTV